MGGGALEDARAPRSLASLARVCWRLPGKSMPQETAAHPSPFRLGLGTTVFLDQLKVGRQD